MEREIVANAFHHAPWGVPIATYFWMTGISEGIFLIASLGWAFGIQRFKSLSLIATVAAFILIQTVQVLLLFDLGKIERSIHLFPFITSYWHGTAPMSWGVIFVASYSLGMVLYAIFIYKENEAMAKLFGLITFILAGGLCWYTSVVMELNPSRLPNHTALGPILFFAGAYLSGIGALILIVWARDFIVAPKKRTDPDTLIFMGEMLLVGKVLEFFLIFSVFLQMTYGTAEEYHTLEIIRTVFKGPVPMYYVGFGLILPFLIYLTPFGKKRGGIVLASALVMMGMFGMRIGWVLVGQFTQSFF